MRPPDIIIIMMWISRGQTIIAMVSPWCLHGAIMAALWYLHGGWICCDQRDSMEAPLGPRWGRGGTMVAPWWVHGGTMVGP